MDTNINLEGMMQDITDDIQQEMEQEYRRTRMLSQNKSVHSLKPIDRLSQRKAPVTPNPFQLAHIENRGDAK